MRVFHVISGFENGGVEALLWRMIAVMPQDIEWHIVAHAVPVPACRARFEALGVQVHLVPCRKRYLAHRRALKALFLRYRPDAVHVHTTEWGAPSLSVAKAVGVPMRIQHSHAARREHNPFLRVLYRMLLIRARRNATHCVACGRAAALYAFGKAAVAKGRVTVLPNGIDTAAFAFSAERRRGARAALGLPPDAVAVGMVARFSHQKNHKAALRIFAAYHKIEPRAVLLLVGDGPLRAATERRARRLLPPDAVRFLGVREDVAALYAAMDTFLLPSRFEGLPITLVEAQTAGLACVVSDCIDGEVNFSGSVRFLPVKDTAAFVAALRAPTPAREGAEHAAHEKGFSLAAAVAAWRALYGI
ncbi:MAG: glycosyltransferase [Clostridia bacterium]|nr:glycosyltransferase [Clostridia bacterium]